MKPIVAILFDKHNPRLLSALAAHPLIAATLYCEGQGGAALSRVLHKAGEAGFALIIPVSKGLCLSDADLRRLLAAATDGNTGLLYGDYFAGSRTDALVVKLAEYQAGSIRDDFSFGPVQLYSMPAVRQALGKYSALSDTQWAGLYELRLKVSCVAPVVHITEPCSLLQAGADLKTSQFAYVDPRHMAYQKEMETVATEHLKHIGAYCVHESLAVPDDDLQYPVTATVVIPVLNRERTIAEAVQSALAQKTDFSFNVIVVQNHSIDRTPAILDDLAGRDSRVVHLMPQRTDLGIGGCWNEAVQSARCGRFVCQLDSDDLYSDAHTLAKMVDMLSRGCGMAVGSYRLVNFNLEELPPGIIDHREWTDENGRNNLLRVNGIGAPRAFATSLLRKFPFPNASYGEDYAAALRISRDYRVGRIYEPLYLCRRWEDNTDAGLSNEQEVRYAEYKDSLRTQEIKERQLKNRSAG